MRIDKALMYEERDYRDEELRQQSLMGNCQDIITGIGKLKSDSYQRAIWELVQNARDASSEGCIINIQLYKDKLEFSHNGEPFNIKSLGALIMQNSAKPSNDETKIGQYGTGFMITHIFNHVVRIDGTFDDRDKNGQHIAYYPINHFEINRDTDTPEELLKKMTTALDAVLAIHKGQAILEKREWTKFTYELDNDKASVLDVHLNQIISFIPIVLILNKSIKEITISSECSNIQQSYSLDGETYNELVNEAPNWRLVKQIVNVRKEDVGQSIEIHSLQSENGQDVIVIPPYPTCLGNIKEMPSLFLNFPLLGTEQFGVNFIFHSKDFFPVEERNGIMLPHKSIQYPDKPRKNKEVLIRMFDVLFAYYANPSNAENLPMDCCRVEFVNNEMSDDEELTNFYKELQQMWAKQICNWKIIPTSDDKRSSINDHNVCVLDVNFYHKLEEEDIRKYQKTIASFGLQTNLSNGELAILPEEKYLIEWSKIVNNWHVGGEVESVVTIKEVCESIKGKTEYLHAFLEWLNKIDSKDIFETLALIPNREGTLYLRSKLRTGKTITKDLYKLARPILDEKLDCLVDEQYADLYDFTEYTRSDLQNDMTAKMTVLRKVTFSSQSNKIPVEELENGEELLNALVEYCYAFPNYNSTSLRKEIVPVICKIYKKDVDDFEPHIISSEGSYINGNTIDIYESAFNYLLDNTLFSLSKKDIDWVKENKEILLTLLTILKTKTNDQDHHKRLESNAVFPNRNGKLCEFGKLKKNIENDEYFVNEYYSLTNYDLNNDWVDVEFQNLMDFPDESLRTLGTKLETEIIKPYIIGKRNKDATFIYDAKVEDSLLTIVHKIELEIEEEQSEKVKAGGLWKEYFDYVATNLHVISYELGSDEQKKALYTIKKNIQDDEVLKNLAKISASQNINMILESAVKLIKQEKERERQFLFTLLLGKKIEDIIRNEINKELSQELTVLYSTTLEQFIVKDQQGGQDIIIQDKGGNNLYYIECKAKWNFHEKAHMSSMQIKKAVNCKDNYALLCVYCAEDGANISTEATELDLQNNIERILANTKAHLEIGTKFQKPINALITYENETINEDEEQNIKLYDNVGCDIPKPVFTKGMSFADFILYLQEYLQNCTKIIH